MNRRIFRYMSLLILFTILACAAISLLLPGAVNARLEAGLAAPHTVVLNESGEVIFDSRTDSSPYEGDYMDRPEVIDAVQNGSGERADSVSDGSGETHHYYASRMPDGKIIWTAATLPDAVAAAYRLIPGTVALVILAALFAFLLARSFARRIVAPITRIDPEAIDTGGYDELLPLVRRIREQSGEIAERVSELESRENTIKIINESMQEGLILLDEKGTVITANRSSLRILGVPEALGKNIVQVFRDARFLEKMRECRAGERVVTTIHLSGGIYTVFFNPVQNDGKTTGMSILFVDSTERYAAEKQRKEFSANVSHELKTPLTTISALSEMISDGTARPEDTRRFGEKISLQSKRLIEIVDDIIKLSEFDEGNLMKEFSVFNLYELANSVISALSEKAAARGIKAGIDGGNPFFIFANRRMIDELLYNLVDNAIKYNRDGGTVTVSFSQAEGYWKISVSDTGVGIAEKHFDRIFERFYRVEKSRSKKTGGTGLGLSIVKHIAEFHRGRVEIERSAEGVGTTVSCYIPKRA